MIQGSKRRIVCHGDCDCGASGLFEPELRPLATQVRDVAQARRLLVIAAVLDGAAREEAAKIGGMGWQTLRDWLIRFNDQGPDGLINKSSPGAPGKLSKRAQGVSRPPSGGRADPGDPSG